MSVHVSSEQHEAPLRTRATDGEHRSFTDVAQLLHQAQSTLELAGRDAARIRDDLTTRIAELQKSAEEMERLLVQAEHQAAQLANLYVATYQLHASLDPVEINSAIADIATHLLGAERFRLLIRLENGRMAFAFGAEPRATGEPSEYGGGDVLVDACLRDRVLRFGPEPGSSALVVVPLSSHGELVGVLAIDALFRQKASLSREDHQLLDLVGAHAASALLAARAYQSARRKVDAFDGLLGLLRKGTTP